jgi:NAD(P)-dependent dehydrogenase (short-subunit alcohol dehydrogenase family)
MSRHGVRRTNEVRSVRLPELLDHRTFLVMKRDPAAIRVRRAREADDAPIGVGVPSMKQDRTAMIVGASRGLGFALVEEYLEQGWSVVATERSGTNTPLEQLARSSAGRLEVERIDINHPDQVEALRLRLQPRRFDLLFVNAGVGIRESSANVSTDEFVRVMVTNALSPMRFVESFRAMVIDRGTIAVMSSGQGSITNNDRGGYEGYRASKTALNSLMRSFAARQRDEARTLLLLAPGWVRTELGGPDAPLSIEESIPSLVRTVTAQEGRSGLQYLDYLGRTVPW